MIKKGSLTFGLCCSWWEPHSLSYNIKLLLKLFFINGRSYLATFAQLYLPCVFLQHKKGKTKADFLYAQHRSTLWYHCPWTEPRAGLLDVRGQAADIPTKGDRKSFLVLVHALFGSKLGAAVEASFTGAQQHLAMPFTATGWHGKNKLEKPSVSSSCGSTLPSVWSTPKGKSRGFECSLSKHLEQTLGICRNHRVYS